MKSLTQHLNENYSEKENINENTETVVNEDWAEITATMSKGELEYFVGMIIGGVATVGTLTAAYISQQIAKSKLKKETVAKIKTAVNEGSDEESKKKVVNEAGVPISWKDAVKLKHSKKSFTIDSGENGITTQVETFEDGFTLTQTQGASKNSVFITDEQHKELHKKL